MFDLCFSFWKNYLYKLFWKWLLLFFFNWQCLNEYFFLQSFYVRTNFKIELEKKKMNEMNCFYSISNFEFWWKRKRELEKSGGRRRNLRMRCVKAKACSSVTPHAKPWNRDLFISFFPNYPHSYSYFLFIYLPKK